MIVLVLLSTTHGAPVTSDTTWDMQVELSV
jgi:hypothetical protein